MAERVGQVLGNYQLLRLLGRGAFAEVYLAEPRYLEVPAAIKVLHVHMKSGTQEHFLREARTIVHLQHPHIIRVHDFGFQDQTPFLVMESMPPMAPCAHGIPRVRVCPWSRSSTTSNRSLRP